MGNLLRLLTGNSSVQSTPSVDLDHLDLQNDLSVSVELDIGEGWEVLEPWQTRRMAKEAFQIRLRDDESVGCGISKEHVENLHENMVLTSKHLGDFSEIIRAEAKKTWSQIYLADDPTGSFHFINDLGATVEVNYGGSWRILYPKQERLISAESFTIRLQEAPAVTSIINPQQLTQQSAAAAVTLRSAKDLEEFTAKAIDWVKEEEKNIEKEAKEKKQRKKVLEDKAAEIARKRAYFLVFVLMASSALLIVVGLVSGNIETVSFPLTALVVFLLLQTFPPGDTERTQWILLAISLVSVLAALALLSSLLAGLPGILEPTLGSSATLVILGLALSFFGVALGIMAHAHAAGGFLRDLDQKDAQKRLKEENIVFEGTVSEESLG